MGIIIAQACTIEYPITNENTTNENQTIIEVLAPEAKFEADTKTSLQNQGSGSYAVVWNDADAIWINGETSSSININPTNAGCASFTFDALLQAPYYAISKSGTAPSFADGKYTFTLPSEQVLMTDETFDPSSAVLLGYSETAGALTFSHAMSCIKFQLTQGTDTDAISSISITGNKLEALSGEFEATYTDGLWDIASTNAGSTITVPCNGSFTAEASKTLMIMIPAGNYANGLTITVKDVNSHYMTKKSVGEFSAVAGKIYPISFAFNPQGTYIEGDIFTLEDWNSFAKAVSEGNDFANQTITLRNNLSVDTFFDYANGTFKGTFNGNGKTMTANANQWPLFNTIGEGGRVENLTVAGEFKRIANTAESGNATISKTNLGTIYNCINKSSMNLALNSACVIGSISCRNGGIIEKCENHADITLRTGGSNVGIYGGGISAIGHTVSGAATATNINIDETCSAGKFIDCVNLGKISMIITSGIPIRNSLGGICGIVYMNGVQFQGCINKGYIERISDGEGSNNGTSSVGGILGRSAAWFTSSGGDSKALDNGGVNGYDTKYINCKNEATIYCSTRHSGGVTKNASLARTDNVGGIVGAAIGKGANLQKFENCENTGNVIAGWATTVNTAVLGGIAGIATSAQLDNCSNSGNLKAISAEKIVGAAGGLVGMTRENVTVSNCISKPQIEVFTVSGKPLLYGLVFGGVVTSSSINSAQVGGSIMVDGTTATIDESNFNSYIVSASTNVQPTMGSGVVSFIQ